MAVEQFHGIIGQSSVMRRLFQDIRQVADADGPVLIQGESGTGKELVARAVHEQSSRKSAPYMVVNCGRIPSELMESEFFGHAAGAYTGARKNRALACSSRPTAAPCCWMRLARCPSPCRPSCCAPCRTAR
ncbi:sigma 54-interacting transcriptional regulator [Halopseudomonas pachastrellae]|nr:sigma 54-interacting transcriptional regulator [Halopseudomonas pachastrellae]